MLLLEGARGWGVHVLFKTQRMPAIPTLTHPPALPLAAAAAARGRVVELYEVALSCGMLAAALGDAAMQGLPPGANWRCMVGAPVLPALLLSRESRELG